MYALFRSVVQSLSSAATSLGGAESRRIAPYKSYGVEEDPSSVEEKVEEESFVGRADLSSKQLHPIVYWEPPEREPPYFSRRSGVRSLLSLTTLPGSVNLTPMERGLDQPTPLLELTFPTALPADLTYLGASCRDYRGRVIAGSFEYRPPPGTVLPAGLHEVTVCFSPSQSHKYSAARCTKVVRVLPARAVLLWDRQVRATPPCDEVVVSYGEPLPAWVYEELRAFAPLAGGGPTELQRAAGRLAFSHPPCATPTSARSEDGCGPILEVGLHRLTAEFEPAAEESRQWSVCRGYGSLSVRVIGGAVPLRWDLPVDLTLQHPQQLPLRCFTARALPGPDGHVIAGILKYHDLEPEQTVLPAGLCTLTASFDPADKRRFRLTEVAAQVRVDRGQPLLVWVEPAPIREGDPLDDRVLSCEVRPAVRGTFRYFIDAAATAAATAAAASSSSNYGRRQPPSSAPLPVPASVPISAPSAAALEGFDLRGKILPRGVHHLTAEFIPEESGNWQRALATSSVRVLPPRQTQLLWEDRPEPLRYPQPLALDDHLTAVVADRTRGDISYLPPPDTVLPPGTHTIEAVFTPTQLGVLPSRASMEVEVLRGLPQLRWPPPKSLLEGQGILLQLLNCKCVNIPPVPLPRPEPEPVAAAEGQGTGDGDGEEQRRPVAVAVAVTMDEGKWEYDPPAGTILPPGEHTLTVRYRPPQSQRHLWEDGRAQQVLVVRSRPKAAPAIVWRVPEEALTYPVRLDEQLLGARAAVSGYFSFSPARDSLLDVGSHSIEATFEPKDRKNYLQTSATQIVTVVKGTPQIVWKPLETDLTYGAPLSTKLHLNAVCGNKADGKFVYDPGVGARLQNGQHSVACRFVPSMPHNYHAVELRRDFYVHRAVPKLTWPAPPPLVYPTSLNGREHLAAYCADSSVEGDFKYSHSEGEVLPVGQHTLTVRFYSKDIINYFSADAQITITVIKGEPLVTWRPQSSIVYEGKLTAKQHFNAFADLPGGTFTYHPALGSIPAGGGEAEGAGGGGAGGKDTVLLTLEYSPAELDCYNPVRLERQLAVEKRAAVLHWALSETSITFGTPLSAQHLCARLSESQNSAMTLAALREGTLLYSHAIGDILPVSDSCCLSVTFTPPPEAAHRYCSATARVGLRIVKATPHIRWKLRPAHMYSGDPLTAAQLCATVSRAELFKGTLTYSPPLDTVLPVGRHKLQVFFAPDQPACVLPAKLTVVVEVSKRPPRIVVELDQATGKQKIKKIVD